MMNSEEWLANILSVVAQLADKGFQERIWLRGEGPEKSSWEETYCQMFDDFDLNGYLSNRDSSLSDEQYNMLKKLRDALERFGSDAQVVDDTQELLASPDWHEVIRIAKDTLKSLGGGAHSEPPRNLPRRSSGRR